MHLKLDSLPKLLDRTLVEERLGSELRVEIGRVLGPSVIIEGKLTDVVAAANDRLCVLERTGRAGGLSWEQRVTSTWISHPDVEVRKLAARTVPQRMLARLSADRSPGVRAIVARRVSLGALAEMIRRFPGDDQLRSVMRSRRVHEAGLAKPKQVPIGHDPVDGKKPMGKSSRTAEGPTLSEEWYHEQARNLMHEYGGNIEYAWEELAVHRFCASARATSGVEIDETKLLKRVKGLIKEKEDMAMERDALRETMAWLDRQDEIEMLEENAIPHFNEARDPVDDLVYGGLTGEKYIEAASRLFSVQESVMPLGIRKYRLGEGNARQTMVPCVGKLPHAGGFRPIDERALDVFCEGWNRKQRQQGEPLRIEWSAHPDAVGKVSFTCSLR